LLALNIVAYKERRSSPMIIAHRGGSGEAVESSLDAFKRAIALGCDGLELDLHVTKDGSLLVFHDETLDLKTNLSGRPSEYERAFLEKELNLDPAGASRVPPCFLEEVIELSDEILISIDIKDQTFEAASSAMAMIGRMRADHRCVLASFDHKTVRYLAQFGGPNSLIAMSPREVIALLFLNKMLIPLPGKRRILSVPDRYRGFSYLSEEVVRMVHAQGMQIWIWTVNDADEMRRFADMGVDAIVTDFPSVAKEVFGG
jgi:glycerophosphoryl diester phosphodiesterase